MQSKTILTVDDSQTIRDMLRTVLTEAGYTVVQACDGQEGVEALAHITPDAIITDINMPRLDGLGFIENVRKDGRWRAVPILVLTTETEPALKERARALGATGWVAKPFDGERLIQAIRRVAA